MGDMWNMLLQARFVIRGAHSNFAWGGVNTLWTDCGMKIFLDRLCAYIEYGQK